MAERSDTTAPGRDGRRRTTGALATGALALVVGGSIGCAVFRYQHGLGGGAAAAEPVATAPSGAVPKYADVQAIFDRSCAIPECHRGGGEDGPPEGLDLSAGRSYDNIVGVAAHEMDLKRVAPGDPNGSYLFRKITPGAEISWHRMPLDRPELPAADRQLIRDWIAGGAKAD